MANIVTPEQASNGFVRSEAGQTRDAKADTGQPWPDQPLPAR